MVNALMRAYAGKLIAPTSVKERAAGYGFASPVKSDLNVLKTVAEMAKKITYCDIRWSREAQATLEAIGSSRMGRKLAGPAFISQL
jgi:hypothetical protein